MAREVIDTVPDADGDEIEVSVYDDGSIRLRMVTQPQGIRAVVVLGAQAADRFDRAWQAAGREAGAQQAVSG